MKKWWNQWHPQLQYSCLENPIDRGAWQAAVHGVATSWTRLSDFTVHFHALEKEMAIHSTVLAWRIPGTGEPGGLPSMGSHRVGHDWSNLAAAAVKSGSLAEEFNGRHFFFAKKKLPFNYPEEEQLGIQDSPDLPILTHPIPNAWCSLI